MCEPVDEHDSRGGGFYCCQCNRWFEKECPCGFKHRGKLPALTDAQVEAVLAKNSSAARMASAEEIDLSDLVKALR